MDGHTLFDSCLHLAKDDLRIKGRRYACVGLCINNCLLDSCLHLAKDDLRNKVQVLLVWVCLCLNDCLLCLIAASIWPKMTCTPKDVGLLVQVCLCFNEC